MALENLTVCLRHHEKINQDFIKMQKDPTASHWYSWKYANKVDTDTRRKPEQPPIIPSQRLMKPLFSPTAPLLSEDLQTQKQHEHDLRIAQCAVHLELLEAFHGFRLAVQRSTELDVIFGVAKFYKGRSPVWVEEIRAVKWPKIVEMAVVRFQLWFDSLTVDGGVLQDLEDWEHGEVAERGVYFEHALPPLDVLMVWHAFLLNPKMYRTYCVGEKAQLLKLKFPWEAIHHALKPYTGIHSNSRIPQADLQEYTLSAKAAENFCKYTQQNINLLELLIPDNKIDLKMSKPATYGRYYNVPLPLASLLAQYTDSEDSSIVSRTQLRDAVLRQNSFIDKMSAFLWLRSPSASYTLSMAITRYDNFLDLFRFYPRAVLVPTLDIDIAWHTSQLSAASYYDFTVSKCGRFINHDDTLSTATLEPNLEKTSALYRARFGQEYNICLCWDCQALTAGIKELETARKAGVKAGANDADQLQLRSANGGEGLLDEEIGFEELMRRIEADVMYYRCVEVARRKGYVVLPQEFTDTPTGYWQT